MADSEAAVLQIEKVASADDVRRVVAFVRAEWRSLQWLTLDFTSVGERPSERLHTQWGEILANSLLGELSGARLRVCLPITDAGLTAFARAGLLYAFAQRNEARTEFVTERQPWGSRQTWAATWRPGDPSFRRDLFGMNRTAPDEIIQDRFVTFLNPHLSVEDSELVQELADAQALPWLAELIARIGQGMEIDQRVELVSALTKVVTELILNIGHAFRRHTGPGGEVPPGRQRSYVQVYATEGGGADSHNRLHVVVADLGLGILRTLRPKLQVVEPSFRNTPSSVVVEELLSDRLPNFGRASGLGYKRIVDAVGDYGGRLTVSTGSVDAGRDVEVILAEADFSDESNVRLTATADPTLWFIGTTVHAVLPIQPRQRRAAVR